MTDGFPNKPRILKGAFVEYGLSLPPLFVVFQFNPEQLTRRRSVSFSAPGEDAAESELETEDETPRRRRRPRPFVRNALRELHQQEFPDQDNLIAIRDQQLVDFDEESIGFEIRLDCTEELNEGDAIAGQFGVLPQLSTLEMMLHPKSESVLGALADSLLNTGENGFGFAKREKPPLVLFIWGYTRVLPVNLLSLSISETEFNTILSPTRATVSVDMQVIESKSIPYTYSKVLKEAMAVLNLANIADVKNVVIPG